MKVWWFDDSIGNCGHVLPVLHVAFEARVGFYSSSICVSVLHVAVERRVACMIVRVIAGLNLYICGARGCECRPHRGCGARDSSDDASNGGDAASDDGW